MKQKLLEMALEQFPTTCLLYFSPVDEFPFFWSYSADAAYFILQAAGLSAKKLDFFLEILTYCHKIKMSRVLQLKKKNRPTFIFR